MSLTVHKSMALPSWKEKAVYHWTADDIFSTNLYLTITFPVQPKTSFVNFEITIELRWSFTFYLSPSVTNTTIHKNLWDRNVPVEFIFFCHFFLVQKLEGIKERFCEFLQNNDRVALPECWELCKFYDYIWEYTVILIRLKFRKVATDSAHSKFFRWFRRFL
jgi:hypothetical protein